MRILLFPVSVATCQLSLILSLFPFLMRRRNNDSSDGTEAVQLTVSMQYLLRTILGIELTEYEPKRSNANSKYTVKLHGHTLEADRVRDIKVGLKVMYACALALLLANTFTKRNTICTKSSTCYYEGKIVMDCDELIGSSNETGSSTPEVECFSLAFNYIAAIGIAGGEVTGIIILVNALVAIIMDTSKYSVCYGYSAAVTLWSITTVIPIVATIVFLVLFNKKHLDLYMENAVNLCFLCIGCAMICWTLLRHKCNDNCRILPAVSTAKAGASTRNSRRGSSKGRGKLNSRSKK